MKHKTISKTTLAKVINGLAEGFDNDLFAKKEAELEECWFFKYDHSKSLDANIYNFNDMLDLYKHFCRRWEDHHNGSCCVVERVRDKYLMPKIREFSKTIIGVVVVAQQEIANET